MKARWEVRPPPDPGAVDRLGGALNLPAGLCAVLAARGIVDQEEARRHLRPLLDHLHPPDGLAGIADAAERLRRAIRDGETILVHGDYDVDGVCAAALYTRVLDRLGARVRAFVPHRLRDGYDFGEAGLDRAAEVGASVVLTADCGIVAHEVVGRAAAAGLDVIVTDHHTPGDTLPPAAAVVNPNRPDCTYPEKALCGAGVAFKVCSLLAEDAGLGRDDMVWYLDLVAMATVADLVPLRGENRVLARYGLRVLARTRNPGLRALLAVTGLTGRTPGPGQVAFGLAPRINAAGRIGDAGDALRLLLTDDPAEAADIAGRLDELNRERQAEDRRTLDEALALLSDGFDREGDYGVVLASEGWHPGVIGIVASRIVDRIHRPTVLVALDEHGRGRGSARSIPGFDLYGAVRACAPHLQRFGGHEQAAGMDLLREDLEAFRETFAAAAARHLAGSELLRPRLRVDLEVPLEGLDLRFAELLDHLGPHGIGNPRPVFLVRDVRVGRVRTVGNGHLKLRMEDRSVSLEAIGFGLAEGLADVALPGSRVDAVFQLQVNEYRGDRRVQAKLLDLRPAAGTAAAEGERPTVVDDPGEDGLPPFAATA